ncbi:hypothetical protein QOT17_020718 [Balamuthia mandrillaris]
MLKLLSPRKGASSKRRKSYGDSLSKRERIEDEFGIVPDSQAGAAEETSSRRRSQKRNCLALVPVTPPLQDADEPDTATPTEASRKALTPPKPSSSKRHRRKGRRSEVRFLDLQFPEGEHDAREEQDTTSPVTARHSPPPLSARPQKSILRTPPKSKKAGRCRRRSLGSASIAIDEHLLLAMIESNRKIEARLQGLEATVKAKRSRRRKKLAADLDEEFAAAKKVLDKMEEELRNHPRRT